MRLRWVSGFFQTLLNTYKEDRNSGMLLQAHTAVSVSIDDPTRLYNTDCRHKCNYQSGNKSWDHGT